MCLLGIGSFENLEILFSMVHDVALWLMNFQDLSKKVFVTIHPTPATIWESGKMGQRVRSELEVIVVRIPLMCPAVLWDSISL